MMSAQRWTFELAQAFNRAQWEATNNDWATIWQDAVYEEVFGPHGTDEEGTRPDQLADLLGEREVMELHNRGARILPTVNCMREQAVAEALGLDADESADGEYWTMDGTSGYTLRGPCPAGWTWTVFWGWAPKVCPTCSDAGGHRGGCPQRGAA